MRYLPQTPDEIEQMCRAIGVKQPEDLFQVIPENLRLQKSLDLPEPLCEADLVRHLKALGRTNETVDSMASFLGGGAYHHYIPVAVSAIASRGEFMTAYTPYQPEISQGTLQAIFEYQTMIGSLTGMDLANAGNYDGASSLAEALLMALRVKKGRPKILLAASIHPDYRRVVKTYLSNIDCEIVELPFSPSGRLDADFAQRHLDQNLAALCLQSPNAFGVIEDPLALAEKVHACGALLVSCFSEAISLGFLKSPGALGADIAVGEGASFGNFLNFGGPYLGIFATRKEFVRQMPGRLVGETVDAESKRGFVLVLSTREQHIRREKATSNICTNQALCALATTVYLSLMGKQGLKKVAETNYANARYLREGLLGIAGIEAKFSGPTFNEFVLKFPKNSEVVLQELGKKGIFGGIPIEGWGPGLGNCVLVCATEMNTKTQMDQYIRELKILYG